MPASRRVRQPGIGREGGKFADGKLVGVPVGGPYTIALTIKKGNQTITEAVGPVFVGDLWVLAGQSNMQGVGDLLDVTPPNNQVLALGMDGKWTRAEEPLHWLVDSPDPVHSGDPKTRAERSAKEHKTRTKGAGLGLPFAVAMVEQTRVPIGLVICAHGGTSMEQWNPSKKGEGGNSLYGSMLRQVQLAGGKVKGVLWYQGESDSLGDDAWKVYPRVFADFIASVRADFGQPDLPFYYVQIGRFVSGNDPKGWNAVQDAQRRLPERVPGTAVVSVIDLELDDAIHVGTQGLKRTGQRLAKIAQRELFGLVGATTPTLDRVSRGPNNTLLVKFKGVNVQPGMGGMARGGMGMGGMGQAMGMGMGAARTHGRHDGRGLRPRLEPGRIRRAGTEARAARRRILDPQGRRHADPADLRGRRGHGPRHRRPQAERGGPREVVSLVRLRPRPLLQPDRSGRHGRARLRADRPRRGRRTEGPGGAACRTGRSPGRDLEARRAPGQAPDHHGRPRA